jgi:hypothetical protein
MEGELISMLGEAKNVNNTLEEEIKWELCTRKHYARPSDSSLKLAARLQASPAKWPLCLFELLKCGWSLDIFICRLMTYTDGRYIANDTGYMSSNSGTISNEKHKVRLVNKAWYILYSQWNKEVLYLHPFFELFFGISR